MLHGKSRNDGWQVFLSVQMGSVKRGATCHISWDFSILIFMTHIIEVALG